MLRRILLLATSLWLVSTTAQADGAIPSIYAGLIGGVSVTTSDLGGAPDPNGIALGARAGLTLPLTDIYVGAFGLYHFGEELGPISVNTLLIGGEAGYEFSFGPIVLRPSLGAGLANGFVSVVNTSGVDISDDGTSGFYLSPGANLMLAMGILAGVEIRYNAIFTDDLPNSVSLLAMLGFSI